MNTEKLLDAVRDLYYAGMWHCDRAVDEAALWIAVRDAAGFEPGRSPEPATHTGEVEALAALLHDLCNRHVSQVGFPSPVQTWGATGALAVDEKRQGFFTVEARKLLAALRGRGGGA